MATVGIILFPGTNCERETHAALTFAGLSTRWLPAWSCDLADFNACDAYVIPGGFSYQDRVRAGAIAATSRIVDWLRAANDHQKPILGICNGCQILAQSGIIPNTMLAANQTGTQTTGFICEWVYVSVSSNTVFTQGIETVLPIPINHGEGRFLFKTPADAIPVMQYCEPDGTQTDASNPNGSTQNIAAVTNAAGNVLAMMPHPERGYLTRQLPHHIAPNQGTLRKQNPQAPGPWHVLFHNLATQLTHSSVTHA